MPFLLESKNQVGLFSKKKEYDAIIRFSNAGDKPDNEANSRGMAIKVLGLPYTGYMHQVGLEGKNNAHDLVVQNNSKAFFVKDAKMYADLLKARTSGTLDMVWFAANNPKGMINLAKSATEKVYNVLDPNYFSSVPYKIGPNFMRFGFVSNKKKKDKKPFHGKDKFLADRLALSVADSEQSFDMVVQIYRGDDKNAVEQPLVEWKERTSPYIKVGTLTINKQKGVQTHERAVYCEDISINPWRAHPENRPMGSINRVRFEVYTESAEFRHKENNTIEEKPVRIEDMP